MSQQIREYIRTGPYQEVLDGLRAALQVSEGLIKLSGAAGTGKTALCERLAAELKEDGREVVLLLEPPTSQPELERLVRSRLGLDEGSDFSRALGRRLRADGNGMVLILDDAEGLSGETLRAIRLLANIQDDSRGLVQLLLCGSPALDRKLSSPEFRPLVQHLSQSFRLRPMKRRELEDFCQALLLQSELEGHGLNADALKSIQRLSGGRPGEVLRLWNDLLAFREILPTSISGRAIRNFVRDSRERPRLDTRLAAAAAGGLVSAAALVFWGAAALLSPQSAPLPAPADAAAAGGPEAPPPLAAPMGAETAAAVEGPIAGAEEEDATEFVAAAVQAEALAEPPPPLSPEPASADEEEVPAPALNEELEAFLAAWLDSWESQDVEAFFSHYHDDFRPLYDASVEAWRLDRRARIPAPEWIELDYDRLEFVPAEADSATLRFWMQYDSPGYRDETWKELELRREDGRWRIVEERNLEVIVQRP